MTWTTPSDRTTGTLITAAMWNQMLGASGNVSECPAAKATTSGRLFHATGANTVGESASLALNGAALVATTADGADTSTVILCGGGGPAGQSRGAMVQASGNEAGVGGQLLLDAGAVAGSQILLRTGASTTTVMTVVTGVVVGSPTGGDKGAGSINAVTVWRNGTSLDKVFEPGYAVLPIREMRAHYERHRQLPTLPTAEVHAEGSTEMGALTDRLWETVEVQARYIAELDERLAALEGR